MVTLGKDKISFLAPAAFSRRFPGIAMPADLSNGWFVGATQRAAWLNRVAGVLSEAGIPAARSLARSPVAAPSAAADALLEFMAK